MNHLRLRLQVEGVHLGVSRRLLLQVLEAMPNLTRNVGGDVRFDSDPVGIDC
jgi:hypothetical protein